MAPASSRLLEAWERAQAAAPMQRAHELLDALFASANGEDLQPAWDRLPLGRRNKRLLAAQEALFGPRLECLAHCPDCDTGVEFAFSVEDLGSPAPPLSEPLRVTHDGWTLTARLLQAQDLITAAAQADVASARQVLLDRCLLTASSPEGVSVAANELDEAVVHALGERLKEADPQADFTLALSCPECGGAWEAPFDPATFLWQEVRASVSRIFRDVHDLARAYGWSEAEILALPPARREAYLQRSRA
jgi:hypothetical protein